MDVEAYLQRGDAAATEEFDWGTITWLDGDGRTAGTGLTVGRVTFDPGAANEPHRHPNCEEMLYLVEGELQHSLGDERATLGPGDLLHIPRDVAHGARNVGEGRAVALVAYDTDDREVEFVE